MENKEVTITTKSYTREDMRSKYNDMILKNRELLVETEGEGDELVVRFKLGDGKTTYSQLKYISSLYDLFPNFKMYNNDYSLGINVNFKD
jgi:hypothetical protein